MSEPSTAPRTFQCDRCRLRFKRFEAFLKHPGCQGPSARKQIAMDTLREKLAAWGDPR